MDDFGTYPVGVRHENRNVIAGVGDCPVDQELATGRGNAALHFGQHPVRGTGVPANATNICLDRGQGHAHT